MIYDLIVFIRDLLIGIAALVACIPLYWLGKHFELLVYITRQMMASQGMAAP